MLTRDICGRTLLVLAMSCLAAASAEEGTDWKADTLSGDWGGSRTSLSEKGLTIELSHKSDFLSNTSGGVKTGSVWLANSEAAVTFDLDKLAGWGGTTAFVQYHSQHGDQKKDFNGSYVGSFAGVSNIETGNNAAQFYQAWIEKMHGDSLSILAGLYAIDSEFYVTETSGLFLQPPYGMSAEMAQTGQNGPPAFPMGALALRVKYVVSDMYVQGVVSDGVPGNMNKPNGTWVKLDKSDGTLTVVEGGYASEGDSASKVAIGLWSYTAAATDLTTGENRSDQGAYLIAERKLTSEQGDAGQGLSGFVRYGVVNKDVYPVDWSGSVGLHYAGLFAADDEAGIAMTTSHVSDNFRQLNPGMDSSETVVELTYRMQVLPWLALQPTVQSIMNPGMDPAVKDATVIGARLELAI